MDQGASLEIDLLRSIAPENLLIEYSSKSFDLLMNLGRNGSKVIDVMLMGILTQSLARCVQRAFCIRSVVYHM